MSVEFVSPLFPLHGKPRPSGSRPVRHPPSSQLEREVDSALQERVNIWYEVRDYIAWLAEVGSDESSDESSDEESEDEDENAAASDEASTNGNGATANGHGNGHGPDSRSTTSSAETNPRIKKVSH